MTPEERKVWDQAFAQGRTIAMVGLFIAPLATVYALPWHRIADGIALCLAVALVFGQLLLVLWLPDQIGTWMARRAVAARRPNNG